MKNELNPKVAGMVIAGVVVVVAIGSYLLLGRGQGDRSGPAFEVNFHSANGMKSTRTMPGLPSNGTAGKTAPVVPGVTSPPPAGAATP